PTGPLRGLAWLALPSVSVDLGPSRRWSLHVPQSACAWRPPPPARCNQSDFRDRSTSCDCRDPSTRFVSPHSAEAVAGSSDKPVSVLATAPTAPSSRQLSASEPWLPPHRVGPTVSDRLQS